MSSNTPQIIDGKAVAASVIETVVSGTKSLIAEKGITPGLAVIIVGEDPASQVYVASKGKKAKEVGFHSVQHTLPADATQEEVLAVVKQLNEDESIHGILCQLPVPKHLDSDEIIQSISPAKDVDGLHIINMGKLAAGDTETALLPCTPAGSMRLLREARGEDYSGLNAVVIGRSNLFGKPMGQLLLQANATVTMAHSRTADLAAVCKQADILVAAVGRAEMVKADWVKPGATVIDVGINRIPAPEKGEGKTRLVGDVAYGEVSEGAGAITPVPGGVGPMTIAMLMANTLTAACYKAGVTPPKY